MVNVGTIYDEQDLEKEFNNIKNMVITCKVPITIMWGTKKAMEYNMNR